MDHIKHTSCALSCRTSWLLIQLGEPFRCSAALQLPLPLVIYSCLHFMQCGEILQYNYNVKVTHSRVKHLFIYFLILVVKLLGRKWSCDGSIRVVSFKVGWGQFTFYLLLWRKNFPSTGLIKYIHLSVSSCDGSCRFLSKPLSMCVNISHLEWLQMALSCVKLCTYIQNVCKPMYIKVFCNSNEFGLFLGETEWMN